MDLLHGDVSLLRTGRYGRERGCFDSNELLAWNKGMMVHVWMGLDKYYVECDDTRGGDLDLDWVGNGTDLCESWREWGGETRRIRFGEAVVVEGGGMCMITVTPGFNVRNQVFFVEIVCPSHISYKLKPPRPHIPPSLPTLPTFFSSKFTTSGPSVT